MDKAVATVKENFDLLDTAAGIGGKDGLIGVVDLEAITKTPAAPSHLKEAAQFLLNNPAYRNQLDVAAGIGKVDGLIGKVDVDAFQKDHSPRRKQYQQMSCHNPVPQGAVATIPFPVASPFPRYNPQPMTMDRAVSAVHKHFDLLDTAAGIGGKDGLIGVNDLQAITKNPSAPRELKEAAQFLLKNPAYRNQLDVAAGIGKVDGLIGRVDVNAYQRDHGRKTANGNVPHGVAPGFAVPNLAVLPSLRSAAFAAFQGVQKTAAGTVEEPMTMRKAADVLKKNWKLVGQGKNKKADRSRLKQIVKSGWASPELKAACRFMLNKKGAMLTLANAKNDGGSFGGFNLKGFEIITLGDLKAATSPGVTG